MKRKSLRLYFNVSVGIAAAFSITQILVSFADLLQAGSDLVRLTLVEQEENDPGLQRHPLYTICPIYEWSANLTSENVNLRSAMIQNTVVYPPVLFLSLFNSPTLEANRYTTWAKMMDQMRSILVQCHTFDIDKNIPLGGVESKVLYFSS